MSDNFNTLWLQSKLNTQARNQATQAIEQTGRALPCTVTAVNGSLVTVNFEIRIPYVANGVDSFYTLPPLTLPKAEAQWMRSPTQVGDVGLTIPADTSLAGIDGQGGGVATLGTNYGNLSTLVWVPIAATGFAAPPRTGIAWANGPHGARVGDAANTCYLDLNPDTGAVTIHAGGKTWTFNSSGLTLSNGVVGETHLHSGVQSGSSDTGPPV